MEALQPAPAQCIKNRLYVVCDRSADRLQHHVPANNECVMSASVVRNLGILLDSELSMNSHIAKVTTACFGALRRIRSVSRCLSRPVLEALVVALVQTRLNYGNATLYGLPTTALENLQSVMNAAARLCAIRENSTTCRLYCATSIGCACSSARSSRSLF
jgi:hypothetical protein